MPRLACTKIDSSDSGHLKTFGYLGIIFMIDWIVRKIGISSEPCVFGVLFRVLALMFSLSVDFQVILMLTTDLDGEDEKDKGALDNLLSQLIAELGMDKKVRLESPDM